MKSPVHTRVAVAMTEVRPVHEYVLQLQRVDPYYRKESHTESRMDEGVGL